MRNPTEGSNLLVPPSPGPRSPVTRGWLGRAALVLASLLVASIVLEVALRTYDALFQGLPFLWDPALAAKKTTDLPNPFLLFRGPMQDWRERAKTPEQVIHPHGRKVFRIVCLGGSTTQDVTAFVEGGITYPTELQRVLNDRLAGKSGVVVETINAGFAAHSTMHALVLLQTELLALKPDVLLVYENVNDLMANYFPGPTTPVYANKFCHPFYLPPEMTVAKTTLLDHSRLYTWSRDRSRAVLGREVRYADGPFVLAHAETYRTNLRNIHAIASRHGIRVVFGQQAIAADRGLFERHFRSKSYNDVITYPPIDVLHEHFREYNRIMREVADECGCACANPYGVLLGKHELFVDVVHLNAEGARLVGREFARTLVEEAGFDAWIDEVAGRPDAASAREMDGKGVRQAIGSAQVP